MLEEIGRRPGAASKEEEEGQGGAASLHKVGVRGSGQQGRQLAFTSSAARGPAAGF